MNTDDPIMLCEAELWRAQLSSDVAALDRLLDDAFMLTNMEGTVIGKTEDMELLRSGRLRITKMNPRDPHVLRLGTTVVVSIGMETEATVDGTPVSAALRHTRVWCERPGGWRVVAGHMSGVVQA